MFMLPVFSLDFLNEGSLTYAFRSYKQFLYINMGVYHAAKNIGRQIWHSRRANRIKLSKLLSRIDIKITFREMYCKTKDNIVSAHYFTIKHIRRLIS